MTRCKSTARSLLKYATGLKGEMHMSEKHLKLRAHTIAHDQTAWWYEEAAGICVVQEYRDANDYYHGTRSVVIPWRALQGAMKRQMQPSRREE